MMVRNVLAAVLALGLLGAPTSLTRADVIPPRNPVAGPFDVTCPQDLMMTITNPPTGWNTRPRSANNYVCNVRVISLGANRWRVACEYELADVAGGPSNFDCTPQHWLEMTRDVTASSCSVLTPHMLAVVRCRP